jgi:pimeloyl-ACP methyl ester carboxylesterase
MRRFLKFCSVLLLLLITPLVGFRVASAVRESKTAAELAPENGRFVDTNYGKIHMSEWGDKTNKTVFMTHGMAAWGGLWSETATFLAANGYHVIAIDQAPFGYSDSIHTTFSISAQADRIGQVLSALNLKNVHLVGHSFGGGVALEAALQFPDRFDQLILVCPVTKFGQPDAAEAGTVPLPLRVTPLTEILVSATITNPWMTKFLLSQFMTKKHMLSPQHIAILQKPIERQGNTHAMALWIQQYFEGNPQALSANPDNAKRLAMPVLLLWGAEDTVVTLAEAKRLQPLLDAKRLDVIPDIGHMPQLEGPEAFQQKLLEQLKAVADRG